MSFKSAGISRILLNVFWLGVAPFVAAFLCVFLVTYPFLSHFNEFSYRLFFVIGVPIVYLVLMLGMKREFANRQQRWFN
jgi:hypothetical protein